MPSTITITEKYIITCITSILFFSVTIYPTLQNCYPAKTIIDPSYTQTNCVFGYKNVHVTDVCENKLIVKTPKSDAFICVPFHENLFSSTCEINHPDKFRYNTPCWYRSSDVDCTTFYTGVKHYDNFDVQFEQPVKQLCNKKLIKQTVLLNIVLVSMIIFMFSVC